MKIRVPGARHAAKLRSGGPPSCEAAFRGPIMLRSWACRNHDPSGRGRERPNMLQCQGWEGPDPSGKAGRDPTCCDAGVGKAPVPTGGPGETLRVLRCWGCGGLHPNRACDALELCKDPPSHTPRQGQTHYPHTHLVGRSRVQLDSCRVTAPRVVLECALKL